MASLWAVCFLTVREETCSLPVAFKACSLFGSSRRRLCCLPAVLVLHGFFSFPVVAACVQVRQRWCHCGLPFCFVISVAISILPSPLVFTTSRVCVPALGDRFPVSWCRPLRSMPFSSAARLHIVGGSSLIFVLCGHRRRKFFCSPAEGVYKPRAAVRGRLTLPCVFFRQFGHLSRRPSSSYLPSGGIGTSFSLSAAPVSFFFLFSVFPRSVPFPAISTICVLRFLQPHPGSWTSPISVACSCGRLSSSVLWD